MCYNQSSETSTNSDPKTSGPFVYIEFFVFPPSEIVFTFFICLFFPLIIILLIGIIKVVSIVAFECKMVCIDRSILDCSCNKCNEEIEQQNKYINHQMLVRNYHSAYSKINHEYKEREVRSDLNNNPSPLLKTEIVVSCTNLIFMYYYSKENN